MGDATQNSIFRGIFINFTLLAFVQHPPGTLTPFVNEIIGHDQC